MTRSSINFSSAFSSRLFFFSIIHGFGLAGRLPLTVPTESGNYGGVVFGGLLEHSFIFIRILLNICVDFGLYARKEERREDLSI
jgi:hypothetical protein